MNVYAPYLSLEAARAIVDTLGKAWEGSDQQKAANREGWNIFDLMPTKAAGAKFDPTDAAICRYDDPQIWDGCERTQAWADDGVVVSYCQAKVAANDDPTGMYATALQIEHALNSIRFHTWGADWVDSRMGPDTVAAC